MIASLVRQIGALGLSMTVVSLVVFVLNSCGATTELDGKTDPLGVIVTNSECGKAGPPISPRLKVVGDSVEVPVTARNYWTSTNLWLERGARYRFKVVKVDEPWMDASVRSDPEGWCSPSDGLFAAGRFLLREPAYEYYYLMGAVRRPCPKGRVCGYQFPIGYANELTMTGDGEFCAFANDWPLFHLNNHGRLRLRITRVKSPAEGSPATMDTTGRPQCEAASASIRGEER